MCIRLAASEITLRLQTVLWHLTQALAKSLRSAIAIQDAANSSGRPKEHKRPKSDPYLETYVL